MTRYPKDPPTPFARRVGQRLFEIRTMRDMSQRKLARESKIPADSISRLESAEMVMTVPIMHQLGQALNVEPAAFMQDHHLANEVVKGELEIARKLMLQEINTLIGRLQVLADQVSRI